jgi:hypothetical protein
MARKPDIQTLMAEHLAAKENAERSAKEGLALVKAGKIEEAQAAERRAQIWVDRMTALEAKMRKGKR